MRVQVKLFGPLADVAQTRLVALDVGAQPEVQQVLQALATHLPGLANHLTHCRLAVNNAFAAPSQVVHEQDELALIGMVSGG